MANEPRTYVSRLGPSVNLDLRVSPDLKARIVAEAEREGKSISLLVHEWLQEKLDEIEQDKRDAAPRG